MNTPIIETDRLRLRPLARTDGPRVQTLFPHIEVVRYLATVIPWPYPDDGAEAFLDHILPEIERGTRFAWAITLKDAHDDLLIGIIDLVPNNPDDNRGFWLGLEYHRNGYMTEAVTAVNDFAFDVLGLERLLLNNAEPNVASHRLKEKAGATIVKYTDEFAFVGGVFRRVQWELTRDQWHATRERFLPREGRSK